jgi:hypothetical protein
MTRIVVTSDLHYHITPEEKLRALAGVIAANQPDLTVLAGDLGEPLEHFAACLRCFAGLPGTVAVLAGNHDVWKRKGEHSSQDLWERLLPATTRDAGMLWLEDSVWRHAGGAVAGSMAWYDYSAVDPAVLPYPSEYFAQVKVRYNPDARFIDWPWTDLEMAARLGDALCQRVTTLEADPGVRGIVVVTHVPIFDAQMCRKPLDRVWGFSNAYFGNLTLGNRLRDIAKLRLVVSGHTHIGRKGQVQREGDPTKAPIAVEVIPSDYGHPAFEVYDLEW